MFLTWVVVVLVAQSEPVDAGAEEPTPIATLRPPPTAAARLKNSFGVGFLGATPRSEFFAQERFTTVTPFLGVRWWTPLGLGPSGRLGLEVGGGLSIATSEVESAMGTMVQTQKNPTQRGFGLLVAVPVALASTENVIFSVAPEFRYLATEVIDETPSPLAEPMPARVPGTITSDLSLRAGVEVFFGFIGVPDLSLELSARVSTRWTEARSIVRGPLVVSRSFTVTTSLNDEALGALLSSINVKYYF